jgi:hypothetical protein
MKKVILLLLFWAGTGSLLFAQKKEVSRQLDWKPGQKVELDLKFGDQVRIEGWDKSEVSFQASVEINGGELNEAFLIDTQTSEYSVNISTDLNEDMLEKISNPCSNRMIYTSKNSTYGVCVKVDYVIYVPRQAELHVETISGNIELSGLNGRIEAKSVSGFVDLDWPQKRGAEVSLKSVTGEVFTNLPVDFHNRKEELPPVGYELKGALSTGGERISLESVSGNVYLRKR